MSWETPDGNCRRPRASWVAPDHLRQKPRHRISRGSVIRPPLDPDALLDYAENAISVTEYAQASKHLSRLFPSLAGSSSSSSSSSASSPSLSSSSTCAASSLAATPRSSSPSVVPLKNLTGHAKQPSLSVKASRPVSMSDLPSISEMEDVQLLEDESMDDDSEVKEEGKGARLNSGKSVHDAQAADDAYRAACSALSEGHAEMAVSLLHLASAKCPPGKHIALGKVRRLMVAAMQLVEKKSAVLSSLPVDKDAW